MNSIAIPAILAVTIMVAGMFAFMPIEQASTVHTTIQGSQAQVQQAEDVNTRTATGDAQTSTVTIGTSNNTPFIIKSMILCGTSDANSADGDAELSINTLTIDGSLILGIDGEALALADVLANTVNSEQACVDVMIALNGANAGEVPRSLSSDGGDIVIVIGLGDTGDALTSIKAVALVDGSSTLTVVSGVPA